MLEEGKFKKKISLAPIYFQELECEYVIEEGCVIFLYFWHWPFNKTQVMLWILLPLQVTLQLASNEFETQILSYIVSGCISLDDMTLKFVLSLTVKGSSAQARILFLQEDNKETVFVSFWFFHMIQLLLLLRPASLISTKDILVCCKKKKASGGWKGVKRSEGEN